nr:MAG TPA: hypothetical protein [Caudoviricetes sp.]
MFIRDFRILKTTTILLLQNIQEGLRQLKSTMKIFAN